MIALTACGGGGDDSKQDIQPASIQLGIAIQVFDPEPCESNCPRNIMVLNYVSHDNISNPTSGMIGCNIGSLRGAGDIVPCGSGVAIANPNDVDNIKDAFRTGIITPKPEYMQNRLHVQQFNGVEFPIHFEIGVDVGDDSVAAIINTRDYVEFDSTVDGSYDIYLCLNILTGQVHEALEEPRRIVGVVLGGMSDTPFLSCF